MIVGPAIYLVLANIFYTLGSLFDIAFFDGLPSPRLFKAGLIFSIILTALPGLWAVAAWLITVFTGHKL